MGLQNSPLPTFTFQKTTSSPTGTSEVVQDHGEHHGEHHRDLPATVLILLILRGKAQAKTGRQEGRGLWGFGNHQVGSGDRRVWGVS